MTTGFFGDITSIPFEGPSSTNPLAFKHYDPNEMVAGKRMEDHLRFAICYWHSFCCRAMTRLAARPLIAPGFQTVCLIQWLRPN